MEIKRRVVSKGQGGVGRPQGDRGGGGESRGEKPRRGAVCQVLQHILYFTYCV